MASRGSIREQRRIRVRRILTEELHQQELELERNATKAFRLRIPEDSERRFAYETRIEALKVRLGQLNRGELDDEIEEEVKRVSEVARRIREKALHKKGGQEIVFREKGRFDADEKARRKIKAAAQEEKNEMTDYQRYVRDSVLPRDIREKVENTPYNHGYRYRGILHVGKQPPVKGPSKIFEKKNNVVISEETVGNETRIYEKHGHEVKKLIEIRRRGPDRKWNSEKAKLKIHQTIPKKEDFPLLGEALNRSHALVPVSAPAPAKQSVKSKMPCRFFKIGQCQFGDECRFSHK